MLCCVAALAKGLVGIGLPGLILVLFLAITADWKQLRRIDVISGILCVVVVAFPWYHAMLIRHGLPFWNELFGDNHWRRLAIGRNGDNLGGFDYYVRELGFGLFPWTALAALALPAAIVRARSSRLLAFASLWAMVAYAVVSVSMTKYHHYVLPAVPAIAICTGWFLDRSLERGTTVALLLLGLPILGLVTWNLAATPQ